MFEYLRSLFHKVEIRFFNLQFEVDMTDAGKHIVRIYALSKEKRRQIRSIAKFWDYGFSHVQTLKDRQIVWKVSEKDRHILLSLKSLNPELLEDGSLSFDIEPPVLKYLRRQVNIQETEPAKQVRILDEGLKPTVRARFDPSKGLELNAGYAVDHRAELVSPGELHKTRTADYVRIGNDFRPLEPVDSQLETYLEQGQKLIPVEDTVDFLKSEQAQISKTAIWEADPDRSVFISQEPLQPSARINFDQREGLKIETGFAQEDTEDLIPYDNLPKSRDGQHVLIGNTFRPLAKISREIKEFLSTPVTTIPTKNIPEFFLRDLVLIKKDFQAVLLDQAKHIRVVQSRLTPVVRVSKDNRGWLDFNISYSAGDIELPYHLFNQQKSEKYLQLDDLTWVKVDRDALSNTEKQLKTLEAALAEGGFRLPVHEFASLEEFIQNIGGKAILSQAYQDFVDQLTGFSADPSFQLPEPIESHLLKFDRSLRSYQRAGIHWMDWLRANHLHGILADDMGLGKTLQALCVLNLAYHQTKNNQHSLIIAPKSVLHHWENEIKRVFPFIRTHIYHGVKRKKTVFKSSLPFITITTYEIVNRDIEELSKVPFFYLILDEATKIKNPDSRRTQSIKALNAMHRMALSGTPVENRPAELWSLFDFLMRGHLGQYGTFQRVFEDSIMGGDNQAARRLGRRVGPFLLRRKKNDVAKDLPEKIAINETCELTQEQRQLYSKILNQAREIRDALQAGQYVSYATSILPILTYLKQVCDHPALITKDAHIIRGRSEKFDWILERIEEIVNSGEQVVVFSHFLGMLDLLEACVKENKFTYIRIDGSTNNRQDLIDRFNKGQAKVALLSLMAAGYGINLTAANHVIHADRWWNPGVEDQATDRVHRIGQNRTVFVYHILTEGTLEERIERLLESKRGMADQIMTAASDGPRQWSKNELLELLKPLG
jgi:SNF2 family DNA or RNA helicase